MSSHSPYGPLAPRAVVTPLGETLLGTVICRITVLGEPVTKDRTRAGRERRVCATSETPTVEETIRRIIRAAGVTPDADHVVRVDLAFRTAVGQQCDVDNLVKHVLDACNRVAWWDDIQVGELHAFIDRRSQYPGFDLTITRVARYTTDCRGCGCLLPRNRMLFCSRACYDAKQRIGLHVPCVGCGADVYQSPSTARDKGRQPWCDECRGTREQRKACKRGHVLSGDNLKVLAGGERRCVACTAIRTARQRARRAQLRAERKGT